MAPRWPAALIVTILLGCDNVDWGGAQVAVVPPPPQAAEEEEATTGPAEERLPEGPVLYHVRPANGRATVVPVAEIGRNRLTPIRAAEDWEGYGQRFIATHLRPGTELALFRRGARVGTVVIDQAGIPAPNVCPRTPRASGILELTAGAEGVPEFLAMAKSQVPAGVPRGAPTELEPSRGMQVVSPILAERALRARSASLPGSWSRAMVQLQPFPLEDSETPAFASTFLVDDALEAGHDDEGYSLFLVAEPVQAGFDTSYVAFTDYPTEGKAAPRVVDYLDWDRDGQAELLLEILGREGAWFGAMERTDEGWRQALEPVCPRPRPVAPDTAQAAAEPASSSTRRASAGSGTPTPPRAVQVRRQTPPPEPEPVILPTPTIELAVPRRPAPPQPDTTSQR